MGKPEDMIPLEVTVRLGSGRGSGGGGQLINPYNNFFYPHVVVAIDLTGRFFPLQTAGFKTRHDHQFVAICHGILMKCLKLYVIHRDGEGGTFPNHLTS